MKNIISLGAAAGLALLALAGCGDDEPTTNTNPHFQVKQGDSFTYARYERDMNNQRDPDSKTMHKWVVAETGLSVQGRSGVAKILQYNFDATGTTQTTANPDTVYLMSDSDGSIYMNVVNATLKRIPIADAFADSIRFQWFKISDTKTANAMTWFSFGSSTGFFQDVQYPLPGIGNIPLRVVMDADAYHKGKVATTVGAKSYPNAFHTDHSLQMTATAVGSTIVQDSVQLAFDVDVNDGIIRQAMKSDSVTATIPGQGPTTQAVAGFEMELVSVVRK